MRRATALALGFALLGALALNGCGDADDEPAAPPTETTESGVIELTIRYDDGAGDTTLGTLTCRADAQRAGGALRDAAPAAELCDRARGLADFLLAEPDRTRACTQIFGGPETARVTGTIDGREVDRRFSRTNGCEIADFTRAAGLLQP
ncbi:MAG: hypothetical protein Q8O56_02735 [Solirubrobacteraceae bacterium]|nr:hypothetical protein [Solirubrobacteraceae bacterium]